MLSRVADNLYWFSRYIRRAENTARLVGVSGQLQLDLPRAARFAWRPLIDTVGAADVFAKLYPETEAEASEADVVRFLLIDERNPLSLRGSVRFAREIVRTVRETLPQEVWEAVNDIHLFIDANGEKGLGRRYRLDFLNRVIDGCLRVSGLLTANVSRDVGYQFLRLGTALEQADMTTRIIDAGASGLLRTRVAEDEEAFKAMQWMSVLRSLAAYQMYRRHVRQRVTPELALRFLLQNDQFPRSVLFCLSRGITILPSMPARAPVDAALAQVLKLVRNADPAKLASSDPRKFMDKLQIGLGDLHGAIHDSYFRTSRAGDESPAEG
jgi:uncharacterized alpha-E superfamily protein